jgi:two-component system OmpR family sensor kinase
VSIDEAFVTFSVPPLPPTRVVRKGGAWTSLIPAVPAVRDAGPGLSREDQVHVFDRLYRADTSRGRDSGGLGLGLSIAKAIVEAHRGRVSVRSEPGAGCRFFVRLPLAPEAG